MRSRGGVGSCGEHPLEDMGEEEWDEEMLESRLGGRLQLDSKKERLKIL